MSRVRMLLRAVFPLLLMLIFFLSTTTHTVVGAAEDVDGNQGEDSLGKIGFLLHPSPFLDSLRQFGCGQGLPLL